MTRRWCNLHATTWLVLLAAIALATIVVLPAERVEYVWVFRTHYYAHHGWPFTWLVRDYDYDEHGCASIWSITVWVTEFNVFYLACDIVIALGWVAPLVGGYEIWRRRRARFQFGIKHLLLFVTAVAVCCSYFATAEWRRQKEREAIRELGDGARVTTRWEGPNWLWKFGGALVPELLARRGRIAR